MSMALEVKKLLGAATAVAILGLVACDVTGVTSEKVCTLEFRYGLSVIVKDSVTGQFAAAGAKLVIREGAFADSTSVPATGSNDQSLYSAGERGGTYTVTVSKPGYRDWVKANVVITEGECHVNGVVLTALLQR